MDYCRGAANVVGKLFGFGSTSGPEAQEQTSIKTASQEGQVKFAGREVRILVIGPHGSVKNSAAPYICGKPYERMNKMYWRESDFPSPDPKMITNIKPEKSEDGVLKVEIIECDFRHSQSGRLDEDSVRSLDVSKYQGFDHICLVSDFQNCYVNTDVTVENIKILLSRVAKASNNPKLKLSFMYSGVDMYSSEEPHFKSLQSAKESRFSAGVGGTGSVVHYYMPAKTGEIYQLIGPLDDREKFSQTAGDAQKEAEDFFRGIRKLEPVTDTPVKPRPRRPVMGSPETSRFRKRPRTYDEDSGESLKRFAADMLPDSEGRDGEAKCTIM